MAPKKKAKRAAATASKAKPAAPKRTKRGAATTATEATATEPAAAAASPAASPAAPTTWLDAVSWDTPSGGRGGGDPTRAVVSADLTPILDAALVRSNRLPVPELCALVISYALPLMHASPYYRIPYFSRDDDEQPTPEQTATLAAVETYSYTYGVFQCGYTDRLINPEMIEQLIQPEWVAIAILDYGETVTNLAAAVKAKSTTALTRVPGRSYGSDEKTHAPKHVAYTFVPPAGRVAADADVKRVVDAMDEARVEGRGCVLCRWEGGGVPTGLQPSRDAGARLQSLDFCAGWYDDTPPFSAQFIESFPRGGGAAAGAGSDAIKSQSIKIGVFMYDTESG